jgi:hypothetical protein
MDLKSSQRTVLVYPGGTEIGLEIARSLKPCKEVRLLSAPGIHRIAGALANGRAVRTEQPAIAS